MRKSIQRRLEELEEKERSRLLARERAKLYGLGLCIAILLGFLDENGRAPLSLSHIMRIATQFLMDFAGFRSPK